MPKQGPDHTYRTCRDPDCTRRDCIAFKEGYNEGFSAGLEEGTETQ